jgi:hypothetical protein
MTTTDENHFFARIKKLAQGFRSTEILLSYNLVNLQLQVLKISLFQIFEKKISST